MTKNNKGLFDVSEKRVLIVGGSGILGRAIARAFAQAGARTAISGTTAEKTTRIAGEISPEQNPVLPLVINVNDQESLQHAAAQLSDEWGGLDVLLNAAGGNRPEATVMPDGSFFDVPPESLEEVMQLNFFGGIIKPVQIFGKLMSEQETPSSIINISSMAALLPLTRIVAYSAAKAAVDNVTRWLAVEFAVKYDNRIRVNAVAPGFFLTDQNRYLLYDKETGQLSARGETIISQTPMGRFGDPEELAGVCLWLGSDAARFVTGTIIPVDGGFSAFSGV